MDYKLAVRLLKAAKEYVTLEPAKVTPHSDKLFVCCALYQERTTAFKAILMWQSKRQHMSFQRGLV